MAIQRLLNTRPLALCANLSRVRYGNQQCHMLETLGIQNIQRFINTKMTPILSEKKIYYPIFFSKRTYMSFNKQSYRRDTYHDDIPKDYELIYVLQMRNNLVLFYFIAWSTLFMLLGKMGFFLYDMDSLLSSEIEEEIYGFIALSVGTFALLGMSHYSLRILLLRIYYSKKADKCIAIRCNGRPNTRKFHMGLLRTEQMHFKHTEVKNVAGDSFQIAGRKYTTFIGDFSSTRAWNLFSGSLHPDHYKP